MKVRYPKEVQGVYSNTFLKFNERLKRIGELYEEGKDCLFEIPTGQLHGKEMKAYSRLFDILVELRDIAAVSLKANHEIKQ